MTSRRWPIRHILVAIVFALVLPGLVFCAVLLDRVEGGERARVTAAAETAAMGAADAMDREIGALSAALLALATSPALDMRDLALFHQHATAVSEVLGQPLVLSDRDGQKLVDTRLPFGAPLPRMGAMDTLRETLATGRLQVSDLVRDGEGERSVMVMYPVVRDGRAVGVFAVSLRPLYLSELLQQQGFAPGWIAVLTDRQNEIVARTAEIDRFVGRTASPNQVEHFMGDRAVWTGKTLDGEPILAASQRLHLAGWRISVGVPITIVEATLRSTTRLLAVMGTIAMATACLLAWVLARSVAIPLRRLAIAGNKLAIGLPVAGVRSSIAEVDAVSRALVRATEDLRSRADALAAERAQLAAVIETAPVGIIFADATGRIVSGNRWLEAILRHPIRFSFSDAHYGEWVSYHPDGRLVRPEEYPLSLVLHGASQAELTCQYERGDGSRAWVKFVAAPIRNADGVVTGGVVATLDIDEVVRAREAEERFADSLEVQVRERTAALVSSNQRLRDEMAARAEAEEQLRQVQKMEAVGQLTGGIAHDFNNLLTIVIGSLDLLRRRAEDKRTCRLLDNALQGAGRAATLTARLLAFSRRQPLMPQVLDVNTLVGGMSDLLLRTLGEGVQVETRLAECVWQTQADPNQLENALLNLAVNGRDAIMSADRTGGRLTIETGNAVLDAATLARDPDVHAGDYVRVSVRDTGTGISPDVLARVFEPFYTTKPQGHGTGLGLSQVHGFVKQSGGHVAIDTVTEPGMDQGTTISIYLPRVTAPAPVSTDEPVVTVDERPRTTILLVEDDRGVRDYSMEALRDLGHTVLEADCGAAALRLLDTHPEIGLLLTDVMLPNMDGVSLAEAARRRRPALPVLFASGYTGAGTRPEGLVPAGASLLYKPFTVEALAAKLAEVMLP